MALHYTHAAISSFGGDGYVSGSEAASGFTITGSAVYSSHPISVAGTTITIALSFGGGVTQTLQAVIIAVDAGNRLIQWSVLDTTILSSGLTAGAGKAVRVTDINGHHVTSPAFTFDYLVCYAHGTHIATPSGETPIEDLRIGDPVLTVSGEIRPVRWIGRRRINVAAYDRREMAAPIRIARDAFAPGIPHRDLRVSPDHAIFIDGLLICARQSKRQPTTAV